MDATTSGAPGEIDELLKMVVQSNEPTILEEESFRALMDLPTRTFVDTRATTSPS